MVLVTLLLTASLLLVSCESIPVPAETTPQISISTLEITDTRISRSPLCEYPDLALTGTGHQLIVFTELVDGEERIILKRYSNLRLIDSLQVGTATGLEYRPRIISTGPESAWIVWSARRISSWDLYTRNYRDGILGDEIRLTSGVDHDLRPYLCRYNDKQIFIVWERMSSGSSDIFGGLLSDTGHFEEFPVSRDPRLEYRPVACQTDAKQVHVAWDRHDQGAYSIRLVSFQDEKLAPDKAVSPETGMNMAPALAYSSRGKLTVAWKSDLQPDGHQDLTPWIYFRHLRAGHWSPIYTAASQKDFNKTGEDQSLEFPTLFYDREDRLWIFGRPSQGFLAQVITGDQISPLYRFDVPGWGGRGQLVNGEINDDGLLHLVRRDIRAIYLSTINTIDPSTAIVGRLRKLSPTYSHRPDLPEPFAQIGDSDSLNIFWGDLHLHSSISDGIGTIDESYAKSRYHYQLDFAALTDHEWFVGNQLLPSEWELIQLIGRQFEAPEEFVAIPAYEWTTARVPRGFGHKNVYFKKWGRPIFSYRTDARVTPALFDSLSKTGGIAIPHHIGWTGIDWGNHDQVTQPVVEIVSEHGAFEFMGNQPIMHRGGMPGNFVRDGLAQGLVFGLIGSSDSHGLIYHHGISPKRDSRQTGRVAVLLASLARPTIFNALNTRACYATSGVPILMDFKINGSRQGSQIAGKAPPTIRFDIAGTAPLKQVEIIRDNQVIMVFGKDNREGYGIRKTITDANLVPGQHWYYLRVIQEDQEMLWSSPIWYDYSPAE